MGCNKWGFQGAVGPRMDCDPYKITEPSGYGHWSFSLEAIVFILIFKNDPLTFKLKYLCPNRP